MVFWTLPSSDDCACHLALCSYLEDQKITARLIPKSPDERWHGAHGQGPVVLSRDRGVKVSLPGEAAILQERIMPPIRNPLGIDMNIHIFTCRTHPVAACDTAFSFFTNCKSSLCVLWDDTLRGETVAYKGGKLYE